MTPNGEYLVSGSWDKSIKVFALSSKAEIRHFQNAHERIFYNLEGNNKIFLVPIYSMAVTSDSKYIVSASEDKTIKVFALHAKHRTKAIEFNTAKSKQEIHHFQQAHEGKTIY